MPDAWNAKWIGFDYDPRADLGIFEFRCAIPSSAPREMRIRVSADQRYKLYLNGELVGFGPQRGDLEHWFYETYDLALRDGENELRAYVWNFGWLAPMAQHSARTGFVCESVDGIASTPGDWEVRRVENWDFAMMHNGIGDYYIDVGPGEICRFGACEEAWKKPNVICKAEERGILTGGTPWMLIPRSIPPMLYEPSGIVPVVREDWTGDGKLLDFKELLCAYPRLRIKGATGAEIKLTYAEALWEEGGRKGNRDEVAGKVFHGYQDRIVLSGDEDVFEPLWWRTFRYVLIEGEGDFTLEAIRTGYPLPEESSFEADEPSVKPIWDISVRTAQLCAGETYFDCPYYEQLQYVGDTRIQALIGYYLGKDRQLQRNAVETLRWSIMENGLTQSRYPSRQTQVIPPFSLWWVMMLYDQWLYDDVEQSTALMRQAWEVCLEAYEGDFWQFGDWVPEWGWGVPPPGRKSTPHWLLGQLASHVAWHLMHGTNPLQAPPMKIATNTLAMLKRARTDGLATFKGDAPSEHAESLWRVIQQMLTNESEPWPSDALDAAAAARCTYYFAYYKHLAKSEINYMEELKPWREMIESGLTTFAENPEPTRSDCHAWSAHPILGFFQIVAGVTSIDRGWSKAEIRPRPGSLRRFDARIAHPQGELRVAFDEGRLEIDSPVPFRLVWEGQREEFGAGTNRIG